jgi:ParB-like chromosome segregation protein Spo0J
MRAISTEGFEKPKTVSPGAAPMLQWLCIADLIVDPAYQRPILGKGRRHVGRIAGNFTWACFAPVVVAPVEGGKFAVIDGQHRTTAAAVAGFDCVPCQIVIAAREEQAAAFKAINGITTPISRMALHAAALVAGEPRAIRLADVCARAEVELLRYPVPLKNQAAGQTMAVGVIDRCLSRYGDKTLITALQCVTQTTNNKPGVISARLIKALCDLLDADHELRDRGLDLLEAFDAIDLTGLQGKAAVDAAVKKISPVQALADRIGLEVNRLLPGKGRDQSRMRTVGKSEDVRRNTLRKDP